MFHAFPRSCFVIKKTCRSKVMFRGRMDAASTIFQNSAVDNVSIMIRGFLQFRIRRPSTRCSSREETLFFDPPVAMICLNTICQFRLVAEICFGCSCSAARCEHFFLFLIVPKNPLLFLHIWVPPGDPPSRVLIHVECLGLYSPLQALPVCIALSIFPQRRGGRWWLVPESVHPEQCTPVCWLRHVIPFLDSISTCRALA